jgi:NAD(P)-dependent dehydrogenase (short-subunit alcohol dehydrogenase family)
MPGRLAGKVAVVTGAGRGIGEATARCFTREGAAVVIAERDGETGAAAARALQADGAQALFVEVDVTSPADAEAAVARTLTAFGRLDALVNNAGVNVFHEPLATPEAAWRRCFAVDLDGAWHMARAALPALLDQGGGAVVNIASTHSFSIIPDTFPYPVAKHGLLGLTRALGIQYADRGVRVNAIAPGYVETPLAAEYWAAFPDPAAERQRACALHPPKRLCRPEEVGMTAVFLASDEAPFINAACIVMDGGRSVLYHE